MVHADARPLRLRHRGAPRCVPVWPALPPRLPCLPPFRMCVRARQRAPPHAGRSCPLPFPVCGLLPVFPQRPVRWCVGGAVLPPGTSRRVCPRLLFPRWQCTAAALLQEQHQAFLSLSLATASAVHWEARLPRTCLSRCTWGAWRAHWPSWRHCTLLWQPACSSCLAPGGGGHALSVGYPLMRDAAGYSSEHHACHAPDINLCVALGPNAGPRHTLVVPAADARLSATCGAACTTE